MSIHELPARKPDCEHCFHIEKREDCQRFGLDRKLIEQCCKCKVTRPLKF